jgi:hypothetical protein
MNRSPIVTFPTPCRGQVPSRRGHPPPRPARAGPAQLSSVLRARARAPSRRRALDAAHRAQFAARSAPLLRPLGGAARHHHQPARQAPVRADPSRHPAEGRRRAHAGGGADSRPTALRAFTLARLPQRAGARRGAPGRERLRISRRDSRLALSWSGSEAARAASKVRVEGAPECFELLKAAFRRIGPDTVVPS